MTIPKKGILIALGELFLKSKEVKRIFQKKLIQNLFFVFKKKNLDFRTYSFHERIFIETENLNLTSRARRSRTKGRDEDKSSSIAKIIKNTFGISWFSEALFFEKTDLNDFSEFIAKNYKDWIKKGETFALRLKRDKGFLKETSEELINRFAKPIKEKVNLKNPKKEIFIEARKFGWFLYFKKKKGIRGLPVSTGGKVLSLISGGIDSPVASFLISKRGGENIWLHFHSFPLVSKSSLEKVKDLAKIFLNYQPRLKIYFLPFSQIQMKIKIISEPRHRILLYRKIMLKIAQKIAKKENCQAIMTGESLGQVSSQTLPNLGLIQEGIKIPILRPLVAFNKEEIIDLAKKIKTFEISIKPQEDCCSLFVPKGASAKGNLEAIKKLEKKLDIQKLISTALREAEIENY